MIKVLLTGAAGFIGYNVYQGLYKAYEVIGVDNFSAFSNQQIKYDRLHSLIGGEPVWDVNNQLEDDQNLFYRADIADRERLDEIFAIHQFDAVIHLAAMTGVRQSLSHPAEYERSNINGFINVLESCKKYGVKKLIYASSSSVYGGNDDIPFKESAIIENLLSFYAITKRSNELEAEKYSSLCQMQIIGLRFFTVYGPWTRPDMATYQFIQNIINEKPITLFDHGKMERDFTYVGDIVVSMRNVLQKILQIDSKKGYHSIYNVGAGKPVNLRQYVALMEEILKKKAIINNGPMSEGEMAITYADCNKILDFTGFRPETKVQEGLAATIEWYISYRSQQMK